MYIILFDLLHIYIYTGISRLEISLGNDTENFQVTYWHIIFYIMLLSTCDIMWYEKSMTAW